MRPFSALRKFKSLLANDHGEILVAILDFSYQHYALGDLLTSQVDAMAIALDGGIKFIDVDLMTNPGRPAAHAQSFITPDNYISYLDNIAPIFDCNPMLRRLRFVRHVPTFDYSLLSYYMNGVSMFPDLKTHLKMSHAFPLGHHRINSFCARHGRIPQLVSPRHYRAWAARFRRTELEGRPLVVINPRQSSLSDHPAVTYRDAPLTSWHAFIDAAAERWPKVIFVMAGGYQEWEHRLVQRRNVFVPRANGLTLAHELALMGVANLFMGTSSGFATFATFTSIPYAILNIEHYFSQYAGIKPHDRHYPFGKSNQVLTWHKETVGELLSLFEELYDEDYPGFGVQTDEATSASPAGSAEKTV
jgi:hypothetical protein